MKRSDKLFKDHMQKLVEWELITQEFSDEYIRAEQSLTNVEVIAADMSLTNILVLMNMIEKEKLDSLVLFLKGCLDIQRAFMQLPKEKKWDLRRKINTKTHDDFREIFKELMGGAESPFGV